MMEKPWKYTDPKGMPLPVHKVGDIVYIPCPWSYDNYEHISKCEIRKINVFWSEDHWEIVYYLRTDIGERGLQSSRQCGYHYEDGNERTIFDTQHEVIELNVRQFFSETQRKMNQVINKMHGLGYTEEAIKQMLNPKRLYEIEANR